MAYSLGPTTGPQYAGQVTKRPDGTQQIVGPQGAYQPYTTMADGSSALYWGGQSPWQQFSQMQPQKSWYANSTSANPQTMPGANQGTPATGTASAAAYTPPPPAAGSATATNPFLALGLNSFTQTQQPFDTSYLDNLSKSLFDQANQNYFNNLKPTLDSNAIMAGGYGGDRAKLAQGVVMDNLNRNVVSAMAPQYAAAYESSLNRALQGGNAAAGVGTNLEQLDLNRMLGIGGLENQTRQLDANIINQGADLALREMLGLGGLENQRLSIDNDTARVAQAGAGVPTYTNPAAAGVGGALGIAQLLKLIFG